MIEWGEEFLNVRVPPRRPATGPRSPLRLPEEMHPVPAIGGDWTDFAADANANAATLQQFINRCHDDGGGIVHFPPGRYYIGRNRVIPARTLPLVRPTVAPMDAGDIVVPADVTLRFAPGAVLVPLNFREAPSFATLMEKRPDEQPLVFIEIQGEIMADLRQIFDTVVRPGTANMPQPLLAGMILFTGTRVREVYPEWWNIGGTDAGLTNLRAIQAAIDAAHTCRRRPMRTPDGDLLRDNAANVRWWRLPPIPVFATATYYVESGLEVGVRSKRDALDPDPDPAFVAPNTDPFVLLGAREVGNAGSGSGSLSRVPVLDAEARIDVPVLSIRGLPAFKIRDVNFSGAKITKVLFDVELRGGSGHAEVSNCAFVQIGDIKDASLVRVHAPPPALPSDDVAPARSRTNLAFTRCHVQTSPPPPPSDRALHSGLRGVELDVSDDVNVEFLGCIFSNVADPMISARQGRFTLNECMLHTLRLRPDHTAHSSNGADIYISPPTSVGGIVNAPASFTCREVETQSFQFLSTFTGEGSEPGGDTTSTPPTDSCSACIVINLHHNAVEDRVAGWESTARPSIFWDGPGRRGAHLVLIGCRFKTEYRDGPAASGPLGAVRVGPDPRGKIYNLGNLSLNDLEASVTTGIIPAGFIRSGDGGIMPVNVYQLPVIDVP